MTYATQANITSEMKGIVFDTTSQVKAADIAEFLEQADAMIDMYIGQRYTLPIAGSKSLLILKKIAIDLVVCRVNKILDLSKSNPIPADGVVQDITEGSAYRESMKLLMAIRDNKADLPDTASTSETAGLASFHTEPANIDIVPTFDRELQQW